MPVNAYVKGKRVILSNEVKAGTPLTLTDDATLVCTVTKPDGTTVTPAVTHDSLGEYHCTIDTTGGMQGIWRYEWVGTSTAPGDNYGTFYVDDPAIP